MATLVYANAGKTRDNPIDAQLEAILRAAGDATGVDHIVVSSGGQEPKGASKDNIFGRFARTGSTRHDTGGAADIQLVKDGRVISFADPAGQQIFANFAKSAAAMGATGIGAATNYMGPQTMHVGFGAPATWGKTGEPAPAWLQTAYTEGRANPTPVMDVANIPSPSTRPGSQTGTNVADLWASPRAMDVPFSLASYSPQAQPSPADQAIAPQPGAATYSQFTSGLSGSDFTGQPPAPFVDNLTADPDYKRSQPRTFQMIEDKAIPPGPYGADAVVRAAATGDPKALQAALDAVMQQALATEGVFGIGKAAGALNTYFGQVQSQAPGAVRAAQTAVANNPALMQAVPKNLQPMIKDAFAALPPLPTANIPGPNLRDPTKVPPSTGGPLVAEAPRADEPRVQLTSRTESAPAEREEAQSYQQYVPEVGQPVAPEYQRAAAPAFVATPQPVDQRVQQAQATNRATLTNYTPSSQQKAIPQDAGSLPPVGTGVAMGPTDSRSLFIGGGYTANADPWASVTPQAAPAGGLAAAAMTPPKPNLRPATPLASALVAPKPAPKPIVPPKPVLRPAAPATTTVAQAPAEKANKIAPEGIKVTASGSAPESGREYETGTNSYGETVISYETENGTYTAIINDDGSESVITDGGDGTKVLCTYYMREGWLPAKTWAADVRYASTLPREAHEGYLIWANPLVRWLERGSPPAAVMKWALWPIVRGWAREMAHRHDPETFPTGSLAGRIVLATIARACLWLGQAMRSPRSA